MNWYALDPFETLASTCVNQTGRLDLPLEDVQGGLAEDPASVTAEITAGETTA